MKAQRRWGGGGGWCHVPTTSTPRKVTQYPFYRWLVSPPGPVWKGADNLAPKGDSIPWPSSLEQVTIQTTISQPQYIHIFKTNRHTTIFYLKSSVPVKLIVFLAPLFQIIDNHCRRTKNIGCLLIVFMQQCFCSCKKGCSV